MSDRTSVLQLACQVIRSASREQPADRVLREVLKARRDLRPGEAFEISRAVFRYYRWHGWLTGEKSLERRVTRAEELAERFARNPRSFTDQELREGAVPDWVSGKMEISDDWLRTLPGEPRLWLRARAGQGKALANKLGRSRISSAIPDAVRYEGEEDLFRLPEFHAGEFEIQDISSQAVGVMCAPRPGETWWDACAGEGGKMLHLSDLMQNKGLIWASDRSERRLRMLKRRAGRAGVFNYRAAEWDGGEKLPTKTKFDGVLVDAPCSGVGTWQKNPHARWTTTPEDVRELAQVQRQLLSRAANAAQPGGKLIYAVCTLTRAETTEVADWFVQQRPGFEPLPMVHPFAPDEPPSGRVWIWPQQSGGGGMFVAAWRKK